MREPKQMNNFIVIYPNQDLALVKKNYEDLHLEELETHIIFIIDGLEQKEVQTFVDTINATLNYSCLMNTSLEKDITSNIKFMSGLSEDKLFIFKEGNVQQEIVKF